MALGAVIKGPNIPFKVVATSQEYGTYDKHKEGISAKSHFPSYMSPKLINGKIWTYVGSAFGGGYQKLPENEPKYKETLLWIDNQRFVELLDWVYNQRTLKNVASKSRQ